MNRALSLVGRSLFPGLVILGGVDLGAPGRDDFYGFVRINDFRTL